VERIGYQRTMVVGLLIMGIGAIMFIPAADKTSFRLFLCALAPFRPQNRINQHCITPKEWHHLGSRHFVQGPIQGPITAHARKR